MKIYVGSTQNKNNIHLFYAINRQWAASYTHHMKYKHLFFDLDHTLWDFDTNSRQTLQDLYATFQLEQKGISNFDLLHQRYLHHNNLLWALYREGKIETGDLRWRRMWLTLNDFGIANESLAKEMGNLFLHLLPERNTLFPYAIEILHYLTRKKYQLHLITNGFKATQHDKLKHSGIDHFFTEVITSECSQSLKPNRAIFDFAYLKTRAECHECIMIGDSIEADICGAINAGMDQVYVNHLNLPPAVEPTYTVYSLQELELIF